MEMFYYSAQKNHLHPTLAAIKISASCNLRKSTWNQAIILDQTGSNRYGIGLVYKRSKKPLNRIKTSVTLVKKLESKTVKN